MSEKVQRLSPGVIQTLLGSRGVMEADDHGRFVSFADYATLQARLAACEADARRYRFLRENARVMESQPIYRDAAAAKPGDLVQGDHNGAIRYGEVVEATPRHFIVRWQDGFRNTCMQGFAYDPRYLRAADDQQAAKAAIEGGKTT